MDTIITPPVSQVPQQVTPVLVSLSQITSITSTSNKAPSLMSQQTEMIGTSQDQQWTESQCMKCGKRNHPNTQCHKKVTCKKCNDKDRSTKYCTTATQPKPKCTCCRKGKHTTENCKARKKAEKKLERESRASRTPLVASTTTSTASLRAPVQPQAQAPQSTSQSPAIQLPVQQVPSQSAGIEERLQTTGPQSQHIDCVRIDVTFSSTPCIYIRSK